jgi:diadenosine tetraphosphate (Ap4A) HIT family hydrolase
MDRMSNADQGSCPICARGVPTDIVADLSVSWLTAGLLAPLPGYACVVAKRHVREPFELPAPERAAFWDDVMLAAQALVRCFQPVKMNYEIHGNTIPHLHMHLYQRMASDFGRPLPPRDACKRSPIDLARIAGAITAEIRRTRC